ncbi:MAG: TGS domain-containing protein, partial [Methylococcales bacterium]
MITVTLPDGSQREFESGVTVMGVAENIGTGLAKATIAGRIDDVLVDASTPITNDVRLSIVTTKDDEALEI